MQIISTEDQLNFVHIQTCRDVWKYYKSSFMLPIRVFVKKIRSERQFL